MVRLRQALIEMVNPIQCYNSTAVGVANKNITPYKIKSMDMQFHWLRCRDYQGQFRYFWGPGTSNICSYSTNNHPPNYRLYHISTHAG